MAQGHRKKPPPSNVRSKKKGKTQKSGLCGGVEGDLYGIDSCRYVLLVNQAVSLVQKGAGPNLEVWLSRRVLATPRSLPRLVCSTVHPCPPFGRTWQLLPIYVARPVGEWLYAKHSIHYTRLPDYFLAFDLYDRRTGVFHSSAEREHCHPSQTATPRQGVASRLHAAD